MISVDLARQLLAHGVMWQPTAGDRFVIDSPTLLGDIFWISDLTVEVHSFHDQSVLGFNGTTEWALDSVALDQALWLPREDQLRELIGDRFRGLSRDEDGTWTAECDDGVRASHPDVECAYATALLAVIAVV